MVTFGLFAFNQERYIAEAVEAALAQTYSPLQIILSDDFSSDRTFDIMAEIAAGYEGPHEVLLNRNERNQGLAGHINRIAELARGSILVLGAGDDISLPHRVARVVEKFSRSAKLRAVFSGYSEIDESGSKIGDVVHPPHVALFGSLDVVAKSGGYIALGATFAYHHDCLTRPGPIPSQILCEDALLPFRAALLGTIDSIGEPLVLYRRHGSSATALQRFGSAEYRARHMAVLRQELDCALRAGWIGRPAYDRALRGLERWPRYVARTRLLRRSRLLSRLHYAWYYSDIWRRRILARAGDLLRPRSVGPASECAPSAQSRRR